MNPANDSTDHSALDSVRGATGNAQATIADKLDAGANAIRERLPSDDHTADGVKARMGAAGAAVADKLEGSALWLRENDMTDLRDLIAKQLKDHPGRTALIALGLGILFGRSSRR